jgi:hypothetical protein
MNMNLSPVLSSISAVEEIHFDICFDGTDKKNPQLIFHARPPARMAMDARLSVTMGIFALSVNAYQRIKTSI